MKRRSEDEKLAIIGKCLDIEAEGGDVLAYLASEHYVSPRATWINIQKNDLHRGPTEITDGHPTGKKQSRCNVPIQSSREAEAERKIRREMNAPENKEPQKPHRTPEEMEQMYQKFKALCIESKRTPLAYLREQGCRKEIYAVASRFRNRMKTEGYRFGNRGQYLGPSETPEEKKPTVVETPEDHQPAGFHPEIVKIIKDELGKKKPVETPEPQPYKVVLLRPIRVKLNQMYVDLISKAYNANVSDMEAIQEELYMCLMQIMSLRETTNLARAQIREAVQ